MSKVTLEISVKNIASHNSIVSTLNSPLISGGGQGGVDSPLISGGGQGGVVVEEAVQVRNGFTQLLGDTGKY